MRNPVFDIIKGLAIILMLVGHAIPSGTILYKFIYSFHMPLFFMISGYFAKSYAEAGIGFVQFIKKDAQRLLLPYFITTIAILLFTLLRTIVKSDISIFEERAQGLLYVTYDAVPIWFLMTLFWVRVFFRYIMKLGKWVLPISVILSGTAIIIAHHVMQLPFCILTAFATMVFYALGWWHKKYGLPLWFRILGVLCWPLAIFGDRIDLYYFHYAIYPITLLGAVGGSYVVYLVVRYIYIYIYIYTRRSMQGTGLLQWIGINSLIILCFHTFDMYCNWVTMLTYGIFGLTAPYVPTIIIRDGLVLLFTWIYSSFIRPYICFVK